ncbi:unnamed protein product [Rhizophagus irregularis]|nr:unnamed protein product [Rhizophagus irregularis]
MNFFLHLILSTYPIKKALALVEAISRDLNDQLLRVLGISEKQHEQLHQTIVKVMSQPKTTTKIVVEGEDKVVRQEEESANTNDINSMEEVKLAYESVKDIDVLDVSIEGTEIWMQAEKCL